MSKYEPLWNYFKDKQDNKIDLNYEQIESILGFEIDHSFLKFKKELLEYGYMVDKISMKNKIVHFKKVEE